MNKPFPHNRLDDIEVLRRVDLGGGRVVATVRVGAFRFGSILVVDGAVSWPRTTRGYEVVAIEDDQLRQRVETEILRGAA